MIRRETALCCSSIIASLVLASGCAAEARTEPLASPTYVEGASIEAAPAPPGPVVDTEVVEVEGPPVVDIEAYPSVVFEGEPVYYVGGAWYRHGPRGWGYFREEPRGLAQQREVHASEPRWVRAREASVHVQARIVPPAPEAPRAVPSPAVRVAPGAPAPEAVPHEERGAEPGGQEQVRPQPERTTMPTEPHPGQPPGQPEAKKTLKPGEEDPNAPPPATKRRLPRRGAPAPGRERPPR